MIALSFRRATECETAAKPRCVCRCRGKLHGANRTADVGTLPTSDPHYPEADAEQRLRETNRVAREMRWWYARLAVRTVAP